MIDQDPAAGTELLRDDQVTIVVSTGAGSVIVPDVVGQSEDAARASLAEPRARASTWSSRRPSDRGEDGRVLEQAPGRRARGCAAATR